MAVISLTSDYGLKDHYVAAVKGLIYGGLDNIYIVDISHSVETFNIYEAAFLVGSAYQSFPKGSIHLVLVHEDFAPNGPFIAMQLDGQFFLAANNGVLSLIASRKKPEKVIEIDLRNQPERINPRNVLTQAASHLARGGTIDLLGNTATDFKIAIKPEPILRENKHLIGAVLYIDKVGNLHTNISETDIERIKAGRSVRINLPRGKRLNKIYQHYSQCSAHGNLFALINGSGYLEIAILNMANDTFGGASRLLGSRIGDQIHVEFL